MLSLEELFCSVDDFCQWFEPRWQRQLLSNGLRQRQRTRNLCLSEVMTILIAFLSICLPTSAAIGSQPFLVWSAINGLSSGFPIPCCPCAPVEPDESPQE